MEAFEDINTKLAATFFPHTIRFMPAENAGNLAR